MSNCVNWGNDKFIHIRKSNNVPDCILKNMVYSLAFYELNLCDLFNKALLNHDLRLHSRYTRHRLDLWRKQTELWSNHAIPSILSWFRFLQWCCLWSRPPLKNLCTNEIGTLVFQLSVHYFTQESMFSTTRGCVVQLWKKAPWVLLNGVNQESFVVLEITELEKWDLETFLKYKYWSLRKDCG